jgi:hypothetical protein
VAVLASLAVFGGYTLANSGGALMFGWFPETDPLGALALEFIAADQAAAQGVLDELYENDPDSAGCLSSVLFPSVDSDSGA